MQCNVAEPPQLYIFLCKTKLLSSTAKRATELHIDDVHKAQDRGSAANRDAHEFAGRDGVVRQRTKRKCQASLQGLEVCICSNCMTVSPTFGIEDALSVRAGEATGTRRGVPTAEAGAAASTRVAERGVLRNPLSAASSIKQA